MLPRIYCPWHSSALGLDSTTEKCMIFFSKCFVFGNSDSEFHTGVAVLWQAQGFFVAAVRLSEPGLLGALLTRCGLCCSTSLATEGERLLSTNYGDLNVEEQAMGFSGDPNTWGASSTIRAELVVADSLGPPRATPVSPSNGTKAHSMASPNRRAYYGDL
eukprot:m.36752 g.36752  ORF g.36752 m.36752 type:complete len:160 (+) comp11308_c0_seq3:629-1108(+)